MFSGHLENHTRLIFLLVPCNVWFDSVQILTLTQWIFICQLFSTTAWKLNIVYLYILQCVHNKQKMWNLFWKDVFQLIITWACVTLLFSEEEKFSLRSIVCVKFDHFDFLGGSSLGFILTQSVTPSRRCSS